jgi:hypothetical protein
VLKEGKAGVPPAELARKHGMRKATYFDWRSKYAGTSMNQLRRMPESFGEPPAFLRSLGKATILRVGHPRIRVGCAQNSLRPFCKGPRRRACDPKPRLLPTYPQNGWRT